MGAKQSLPGQPDYDAVTVMSDSRKGKSGLFGFNGRNAKAKRDSNIQHVLVAKDSTPTTETKEVVKGVGLASTEKEKKRFGFRAPVRCVSASGCETAGICSVKPNGEKGSISGDGRKSCSFQPPGMEMWKMIDDDASARSRSSSREKNLESKSKRTTPQMTNSLPVNLNSSRLPSLANRLTRSNTIDSRVSKGKKNKSGLSYTDVPKKDIAEASTQQLQQHENASAASSQGVVKYVPSFLKKPKSFLFGHLGHRKSVPHSPLASTPEKPEKAFVPSTSEDSNNDVQAKGEKCTESSMLTEASPIRCQSGSENEPTITSIDSGQGSSLDACHILTPNSHDRLLNHQSRLASESDAPLAAIDFDDDCSIGSDDLMLDVELGLDNDDTAVNGSHRSSISADVTKKRISISRFSSSFQYPDESAVASEAKVERRSSVIRRQRSGVERGSTQKSDRRLQARLSSASIDLRSVENGEKNALNELISLMEVNQLRNKPSRLMSDGDIPSASGDGSVLVTGTPRRQMSMKPPRQNSIIDEDEQVVIDAFTHRSMAQDLTSVKTMLLKLKRILQEDELQCPSFSQPTLNASSVVISKARLSHDQALPVKGGEMNNSSPDAKPSYSELVEINHELHAKVFTMQRTIDDQQKTISLLQQQMTKYECGMSDIYEEDH